MEEGVPPQSVADRCKEARNNYSSTIHALVSAVKKLQKPERRWLYRGLSGGQLPRAFRTKGFAEWAFMSTTTSLEVARCVSHDCLRQNAKSINRRAASLILLSSFAVRITGGPRLLGRPKGPHRHGAAA